MLSSFRLILIILLINLILYWDLKKYCKDNLIKKLIKKDLQKSNLEVLYSIRYYRCIALIE